MEKLNKKFSSIFLQNKENTISLSNYIHLDNNDISIIDIDNILCIIIKLCNKALNNGLIPIKKYKYIDTKFVLKIFNQIKDSAYSQSSDIKDFLNYFNIKVCDHINCLENYCKYNKLNNIIYITSKYITLFKELNNNDNIIIDKDIENINNIFLKYNKNYFYISQDNKINQRNIIYNNNLKRYILFFYICFEIRKIFEIPLLVLKYGFNFIFMYSILSIIIGLKIYLIEIYLGYLIKKKHKIFLNNLIIKPLSFLLNICSLIYYNFIIGILLFYFIYFFIYILKNEDKISITEYRILKSENIVMINNSSLESFDNNIIINENFNILSYIFLIPLNITYIFSIYRLSKFKSLYYYLGIGILFSLFLILLNNIFSIYIFNYNIHINIDFNIFLNLNAWIEIFQYNIISLSLGMGCIHFIIYENSDNIKLNTVSYIIGFDIFLNIIISIIVFLMYSIILNNFNILDLSEIEPSILFKLFLNYLIITPYITRLITLLFLFILMLIGIFKMTLIVKFISNILFFNLSTNNIILNFIICIQCFIINILYISLIKKIEDINPLIQVINILIQIIILYEIIVLFWYNKIKNISMINFNKFDIIFLKYIISFILSFSIIYSFIKFYNLSFI